MHLRQRRRRIATAALMAVLGACSPPAEQGRRPQPAAEAPVAPPPAPPRIELPAPPPPLTRRDILQAVSAAAEAFAFGRPAPANAELAGRRFEVALPFGCEGPSEGDIKSLGYTYDADTRRLKVVAAPEDLTKTEWMQTLAVDAAPEAIEGFWISRPWISNAECPAPASADRTPPQPTSPETVGLAQLFAEGSSRLLRRKGRAYEITRRLAEDEAPPSRGYRLVLSGRIVDADGPSIRCRDNGPDQRPTCLALVEFDRVRIETADERSLGEWSAGG